jgi:hypothetical protein
LNVVRHNAAGKHQFGVPKNIRQYVVFLKMKTKSRTVEK